jgi:hypothetical protein
MTTLPCCSAYPSEDYFSQTKKTERTLEQGLKSHNDSCMDIEHGHRLRSINTFLEMIAVVF